MLSGNTAIRSMASRMPNASNILNTLGLIWIPAPTSPNSRDCSSTRRLVRRGQGQCRRQPADAAAGDENRSRRVRVIRHALLLASRPASVLEGAPLSRPRLMRATQPGTILVCYHRPPIGYHEPAQRTGAARAFAASVGCAARSCRSIRQLSRVT